MGRINISLPISTVERNKKDSLSFLIQSKKRVIYSMDSKKHIIIFVVVVAMLFHHSNGFLHSLPTKKLRNGKRSNMVEEGSGIARACHHINSICRQFSFCNNEKK